MESMLDARALFPRVGPGLLVGGEGRDRTADTAVFSRVLYRLSYLPRSRLEATRVLEPQTGERAVSDSLTQRARRASIPRSPP